MDKIELEIGRINLHLETLRQSIWKRYEIVATTSTLATAILVIATFNPQLISLSLYATKILVAVLLAIIPISLIDYSIKLSQATNSALKALKALPEDKKNFFQTLWDGSSYLYVIVITLIIGFIIFSILKNL